MSATSNHTTTENNDDGVSAAKQDLPLGGATIRQFLIDHIGMSDDVDVYYLKRTGWPIGKTSTAHSAQLAASKQRLIGHVKKITAPNPDLKKI
jgi:hypothetical protein